MSSQNESDLLEDLNARIGFMVGVMVASGLAPVIRVFVYDVLPYSLVRALDSILIFISLFLVIKFKDRVRRRKGLLVFCWITLFVTGGILAIQPMVDNAVDFVSRNF